MIKIFSNIFAYFLTSSRNFTAEIPALLRVIVFGSNYEFTTEKSNEKNR